jgi:hypothetical protein
VQDQALENRFDHFFAVSINTFAKSDGRLGVIWRLTRSCTKRLENGFYFDGLLSSSLSTYNQIICKKKSMNAGTARSQSNAFYIVIARMLLQTNTELIDSNNKQIG